MSSSTRILRPVTEADFFQVASILNYYIKHTVITFRTNIVDDSAISTIYKEAHTQELPFFVVVENERVLGYIYVLGYRHERPAYRHTVEISIYVHPQYKGQGVGGQLMKALLDALKTRGQGNGELANLDLPQKKIAVVLAVMAFDVNGPSLDECCKLNERYIRLGFEKVGQIKRVGWKFGRWVDDVIMQLSLE
ncbi:acyl-CoA N-acyltransferase [Cyathus striatus]|nr:acyl-CoA N-acyltransferase [Cyathus striatus]